MKRFGWLNSQVNEKSGLLHALASEKCEQTVTCAVANIPNVQPRSLFSTSRKWKIIRWISRTFFFCVGKSSMTHLMEPFDESHLEESPMELQGLEKLVKDNSTETSRESSPLPRPQSIVGLLTPIASTSKKFIDKDICQVERDSTLEESFNMLFISGNKTETRKVNYRLLKIAQRKLYKFCHKKQKPSAKAVEHHMIVHYGLKTQSMLKKEKVSNFSRLFDGFRKNFKDQRGLLISCKTDYFSPLYTPVKKVVCDPKTAATRCSFQCPTNFTNGVQKHKKTSVLSEHIVKSVKNQSYPQTIERRKRLTRGQRITQESPPNDLATANQIIGSNSAFLSTNNGSVTIHSTTKRIYRPSSSSKDESTGDESGFEEEEVALKFPPLLVEDLNDICWKDNYAETVPEWVIPFDQLQFISHIQKSSSINIYRGRWHGDVTIHVFGESVNKRRISFNEQEDIFNESADLLHEKKRAICYSRNSFKKFKKHVNEPGEISGSNEDHANESEDTNKHFSPFVKRNDSFNEQNDSFIDRKSSFNEQNDSFDVQSDSSNERNASSNEQSDLSNLQNDSFDEQIDSFIGRKNSFNGQNDSFNEQSDSSNVQNDSYNEQSDSFNDQNEAFVGRKNPKNNSRNKAIHLSGKSNPLFGQNDSFKGPLSLYNNGKTSRYERRSSFENLVRNLSMTRHENIVLFMGACLTPPHRAIITEVKRGFSLHQHRCLGTSLSYSYRMLIAKQVAQAMSYLHSKGIIHGHLNPRNIFLEAKVKLSILDHSIVEELSHCPLHGILPQGLLGYLPPEIMRKIVVEPPNITNNCYPTQQTDVYMFGSLLYELITENPPYKNCPPHSTIYKIGIGMSEDTTELHSTHSMKDLLMDCWHCIPAQRPVFPDILSIMDYPVPIQRKHSLSEPERLNRAGASQT